MNDSREPKRTTYASDTLKEPEENTIENCNRKQRCTKQENRTQCGHYHHPLLHKSNAIKIGVRAVSSDQGAFLPVMSASIFGQNGMQKNGNILLDSGAQISLIRSDTAELLRLNNIVHFISRGWHGIVQVTNKLVALYLRNSY